MSKKIKVLFSLFAVTLLFLSLTFVRADDEGEDESEEDDQKTEEFNSNADNETEKFGKTSSAKSPTATVKTSTQTTIIKDSDGDGFVDSEDPHPNISEIYIVEDVNLNGIVDKFENEK